MFYGMGMTFNLCSLFLSAAVSERGVSQSQISDAMTLQSVQSQTGPGRLLTGRGAGLCLLYEGQSVHVLPWGLLRGCGSRRSSAGSGVHPADQLVS